MRTLRERRGKYIDTGPNSSVSLQFNGTPISDDSHLVNVISLTKIGTEVPVVLFRKGQTLTTKTTVGDYEQFLKAADPKAAP